MLRHLTFAALAMLSSAPAHGQAARDSGAYVSPAIGLHYGSALRASVALGIFVDKSRADDDGIVFLLEPGLGGMELSSGIYRGIGRFGSGVSLRGAVLRTFGDPWNADPRTTYAGAEAELKLLLGVGMRAGLLRRVSGSSGSPRGHIVTVALTLGA